MTYDDYKREIIDKRQGGRSINLSTRSMRRKIKRKETQPKKVLYRALLKKATKNQNEIIMLNKEINVLKMRQVEIEADLVAMKEHVDRWVKEEND